MTRRARRGRLTRKLMDIAVCLVAVVIIEDMRGACGTGAAAAEPSRAAATSPSGALSRQADRRHDALIKQGFNLTRSMQLTAADLVRFELLIPPGGDQAISVWLAAVDSEVSLEWRGPTGQIVTAWTGRSGEQQLARALAPGRHTIELRALGGRAYAEIGIKGPVIAPCVIEATRRTEQPAEPARGFAWPYVLITPKPAGATGEAVSAGLGSAPADAVGGVGAHTLLVVPPSTGFPTDDVELLRAATSCQIADQLALADRLGTTILLPLFPRPVAQPPDNDLYLHALSRASLEARDARFARVDLQLIAMIDHARDRLAAQGRDVQPRVLITGFSAAGMFVNRFAVLHPERILAAAVISPGGWPLAPVVSVRGQALPYPVGVADVATLTGAPVDLDALRRVRFVFALGDADTNDAVPYRDAFSSTDEALIMRSFGKTPVARWDAARRLYALADLQARFRLYRGIGHEVTPEMRSDIEAAFRAALATP